MYTIIMCYIQFAFGITCTSVGPCLVDLKNIFKQKDMQIVFLYNSINSVGYIIGSLFGSVKQINRQLRIIVLLTAMGIALIFIPRASLYVLFVCGFIIGLGGGSWDSTFNVWVIEMWKDRSGPLLQLALFAFGIGSVVGPLIDKPFIIGDVNSDDDDTKIETIDRSSSLDIPFAIIGSIQLLGAILMLIMYLIKKYEKPDEYSEGSECQINVNETKDTRIKIDSSNSPLKRIIALSALCFASFTVIENCFFQFSPTYNQYIPLHLCAPKAAFILSMMATCFTLGRFLSIFMAIKLKPETMLTYHYISILIALIVLLFAQNSLIAIYVGNILIGFGLSAMWALMYSFMDQYIVITERISSILIFAVGILSATSPLLLGPYIQDEPIVLVYFSAACIAISVLSYITILYLIYNSLDL
ncbi:sodium-dependent glucose transporter 1-like, partial [Oppia nitens]|uniref:sodium-dependent glucose transporter 1-like n=1 Tax=Oppia nitens TaxID=1686743 RepID=UPI0023DBE1B5